MKRPRPRVLIFCGKGGVGKTTCSAAIAARLASLGAATLHLTSDLSPSLADLYGVPLYDHPTPVADMLDAVEISMDTVARIWKERFGPDFNDILSHILDVEGMSGVSDLDLLDYIGSAPSLREETLLDMIMGMSREGGYKCVIWDTAPAGETLRLLQMPRLMQDHLKAGTRVYEAIDRLTGAVSGRRTLAGIMDDWVRRSAAISDFVRNEAAFVVVANPEAVVVPQVERILRDLENLGFGVHGMIINRVVQEGGADPFEERLGQAQAPHLRRLHELAGRLPTASMLFATEELRGYEALRTAGEGLVRELGL